MGGGSLNLGQTNDRWRVCPFLGGRPNLLDSRPKNLCGAELPSGRGNNLSLSKSTSSGELLLADWTIHWSAPLSLSPAPPDSDCIFSPFFGPPLKGLIKACSPPTTYNFFFYIFTSFLEYPRKTFESGVPPAFLEATWKLLKIPNLAEIVLQSTQNKSQRVSIYPLLLLICMNFYQTPLEMETPPL